MTKQLTRQDPFRGLFSFPRFMEDFEDLSSSRGLKIHETDDSIVAEAVVAGVSADDVDINIEDGVLAIKAKNTDIKTEKDEYKRSSYEYYYTAALSGGQWDKASAKVKNGVVTVTIPKAEEVKPRKVKVTAE